MSEPEGPYSAAYALLLWHFRGTTDPAASVAAAADYSPWAAWPAEVREYQERRQRAREEQEREPEPQPPPIKSVWKSGKNQPQVSDSQKLKNLLASREAIRTADINRDSDYWLKLAADLDAPLKGDLLEADLSVNAVSDDGTYCVSFDPDLRNLMAVALRITDPLCDGDHAYDDEEIAPWPQRPPLRKERGSQ